MDFDLFEMEDDDILSSMYLAPSATTEMPNNFLPEFNCNGEDTVNSQFSEESFAKNFCIFNSSSENREEIALTAYSFKKSSLYSPMIVNFIFGQARLHIQKLAASVKTPMENDEISFYQSRHQVTLLLHMLSSSKHMLLISNVETNLRSIRNLLDRIGTQKYLKTIFLAHSCKGNETDSSGYHIFHGFLEWRFLDLIIVQKLENDRKTDEGSEVQVVSFSNRYLRTIEDLLQISACLYKKKTLPDLMFTSPFPCTCVKETWLLLQFLVENQRDHELSFWNFFNDVLDKMKINTEHYDLSSQNIPEFIIWLLKGLVRLQGYKSNGSYDGPANPMVVENYNLLEPVVEEFLDFNPSEEQTRIFLCNLMPIILEWWPPKVNIAMILWEHFHKKLNSPFFLTGSSPSNLAVSSPSGKGYLEKIRTLLNNCMPDGNLSSYTLFTLILGKTIQRLLKIHQNNQVQKLFGRIYTKFSPTKFLALNETGVHNLIELFLTLSLSGENPEIISKLKDQLLTIQLEKIQLNRQVCVTKGHIALMILHTENEIDLTDYIVKLLDQLNSIKNAISVSKIIADGLCEIFPKSDTLDKGEHILIDAWLTSYLNSSIPVEQERTLETIHLIFGKLQQNINLSTSIVTNNNFQILLKNLNLHILPFVKQNFLTSFSKWIAILAADFCIFTINNDVGQFHKNLKFFIDANSANKEAPLKFLLAILNSEKAASIESSTIIQIWLKSLVLLSANNEDVVNLTKVVTTLSDFRTVCDLPQNNLLSAKEPLCVFISAVGRTHQDCDNFQKKCSISDKFNQYLIGFEKWISDKNEKNDITMRFFSFIAIVIFNCASIVYARSKITCFFHIAITRFILPTTIQMGKLPDTKSAQIIHKIWPVLVQGIGRLNFKNDPYVLKTLTDLIVKWTPNFKFSQNSKIVARPFISCLTSENEPLSIFVFEKLTSIFLTMQRRQADPNACLVITIFQEVIEANSSDPSKLMLFLKATCLTTLEHLMMVDEIVPSRAMLLEMFKKICESQAFLTSTDIRELIIEHLKVITVKHLSYFTFFYFELLTQIVNISIELVEPIMEFLLKQIKIVESKRGGGGDNRLRSCYQKLKGALSAAKSKRS